MSKGSKENSSALDLDSTDAAIQANRGHIASLLSRVEQLTAEQPVLVANRLVAPTQKSTGAGGGLLAKRGLGKTTGFGRQAEGSSVDEAAVIEKTSQTFVPIIEKLRAELKAAKAAPQGVAPEELVRVKKDRDRYRDGRDANAKQIKALEDELAALQETYGQLQGKFQSLTTTHQDINVAHSALMVQDRQEAGQAEKVKRLEQENIVLEGLLLRNKHQLDNVSALARKLHELWSIGATNTSEFQDLVAQETNKSKAVVAEQEERSKAEKQQYTTLESNYEQQVEANIALQAKVSGYLASGEEKDSTISRLTVENKKLADNSALTIAQLKETHTVGLASKVALIAKLQEALSASQLQQPAEAVEQENPLAAELASLRAQNIALLGENADLKNTVKIQAAGIGELEAFIDVQSQASEGSISQFNDFAELREKLATAEDEKERVNGQNVQVLGLVETLKGGLEQSHGYITRLHQFIGATLLQDNILVKEDEIKQEVNASDFAEQVQGYVDALKDLASRKTTDQLLAEKLQALGLVDTPDATPVKNYNLEYTPSSVDREGSVPVTPAAKGTVLQYTPNSIDGKSSVPPTPESAVRGRSVSVDYTASRSRTPSPVASGHQRG